MPTTPLSRTRRIVLFAWTVALALLVASSLPSTSTVLSWALLPYLALVARHLLGTPARDPADPPCPAPSEPVPRGDPPESDPGPGPGREASAIPTGPVAGAPPARARPARPRRRARVGPVAEPAPAAWVEVAPGRFVRGESPEAPGPTVAPEGPFPEAVADREAAGVAPASAAPTGPDGPEIPPPI